MILGHELALTGVLVKRAKVVLDFKPVLDSNGVVLIPTWTGVSFQFYFVNKKERIMKRIVIAVLVLLMAAPFAMAKDFGGAEIPDTVTIEGAKLTFNGAGIRKKLKFVKVYAAALFLENKSSDAEKILNADEPMMIRMVFIRGKITPQQLIDSWNESFTAITNNNTAPWQEQIDKFNACFASDTVEGQTYDMAYLPAKGLVVYLDGKEKATIPGKEFKNMVFSIWLGKGPMDGNMEDLKEDMLGK